MGGVSWSFARMSDGSARVRTTLRKAYVEVALQGKYAYDASPLLDVLCQRRLSVVTEG
jgi:hypothetical protein